MVNCLTTHPTSLPVPPPKNNVLTSATAFGLTEPSYGQPTTHDTYLLENTK